MVQYIYNNKKQQIYIIFNGDRKKELFSQKGKENFKLKQSYSSNISLAKVISCSDNNEKVQEVFICMLSC